jgi:hypothetical protein
MRSPAWPMSCYDFLPGCGSQAWRRHITFATVAAKVGVADN